MAGNPLPLSRNGLQIDYKSRGKRRRIRRGG